MYTTLDFLVSTFGFVKVATFSTFPEAVLAVDSRFSLPLGGFVFFSWKHFYIAKAINLFKPGWRSG
jgi:hypothetical protein